MNLLIIIFFKKLGKTLNLYLKLEKIINEKIFRYYIFIFFLYLYLFNKVNKMSDCADWLANRSLEEDYGFYKMVIPHASLSILLLNDVSDRGIRGSV